MTQTSTRVVIGKTNTLSAVHVFQRREDPLFFEDGYIHYIHPGAIDWLNGLTINGLRDAEVHFLGQLKGEQTYWDSYLDNSGILNIVDCQNVKFSGLDVINTKKFYPGSARTEGSCAVNVSRSRKISFARSRMSGAGKITLSVHSGSEVDLRDVILNGYCFEILAAGSTVFARQLTICQHNAHGPDPRSMMWVASSHRHGETDELYEGTRVDISDAILDMVTGQSIVSGNGSFTTKSCVRLRDIRFTPDRHHTFGIAGWSANYNSLWVNTDFDDEADDPSVQDPPLPPMRDVVTMPNTGFGKFVKVNSDWPSRPASESPILVDGLSSADVILPKGHN